MKKRKMIYFLVCPIVFLCGFTFASHFLSSVLMFVYGSSLVSLCLFLCPPLCLFLYPLSVFLPVCLSFFLSVYVPPLFICPPSLLSLFRSKALVNHLISSHLIMFSSSESHPADRALPCPLASRARRARPPG